MENLDVRVVIQLWQIGFLVITSGVGLLLTGITFASLFVKRAEFRDHVMEHDKQANYTEAKFESIWGELKDISSKLNQIIGQNKKYSDVN